MFGSLIKGWLGERGTQFGMWWWLDKRIYHRFHDVIVPSRNGTTQIDHVLVSAFGIFVIETKNYTGWIFGDEHSPQWTVSHFGRKFRFQNPLRQNFRHVRCLSEILDLPDSAFHPIVFLIGECQLKTALPANVMISGLSGYVKSFSQKILDPETVLRVNASLSRLKADPTLTMRAHLRSLKERHSSTTACPKCGSPLVKRVARTGRNAGKSFQGCSGFPKCRFTRPV